MKKIAVVTDTSFYITDEVINKHRNLKILPLPMILNNEKTINYDNEISKEEFHKLVNDGKVKTSQTPLGILTAKWDEYLLEYDILIVAGISKGLSGMYQITSQLAKDKKYKNQILVIDTDGVSILLERQIMYILEYIKTEEINSIDDLKSCVKQLNKMKKSFKCLLFPKSLETLKNGGRITYAAAKLSKLLKIYPILILKKGIIDKYGIMRSYLKGIIKNIEYALKNYKFTQIDIIISEFDDEKILNDFKEMLNQFNFQKINYVKMPNVILAHIGYNVIGFNIWIDK